MFIGVNDFQRRQSTTKKSAFIRNMITGVMQSQFLAHLSPSSTKTAMCMTCEALKATESSCKNYTEKHQKVGSNYSMKCEKSTLKF